MHCAIPQNPHAASCSLLTGFWQDCLCTNVTLDLWLAMHVMACTQGVLTVLGDHHVCFCLAWWHESHAC